MVRKMLVKVLIMLGSQVDEACDGEVAIDMVRAKLLGAKKEEAVAVEEGGQESAGKERAQAAAAMPYDLILMDSLMPRVSGLQATHTIVQELGFTNVVVGVTGNILPADTRGTSRQALR